MTYFKQYKEVNAKPFEISAEEARHALDGNWKSEYLDDIFNNNKCFRLYTPFAEIYTKTDEGLVPIPGFYGVID